MESYSDAEEFPFKIKNQESENAISFFASPAARLGLTIQSTIKQQIHAQLYYFILSNHSIR